MMESIHKCAVDHPDEKVCFVKSIKAINSNFVQILVLSQWTQCLALVSDYLTEQGVLHVMYVVRYANFSLSQHSF
jgi:hypothetical protein